MLGHVWSSAGIWPFGFKGSSEHADDNAALGDADLGADDAFEHADDEAALDDADALGSFSSSA